MRVLACDCNVFLTGCRSLMLVHEPEAAALTVLMDVQDPIAMSEGDNFMVLDAGGGTVDITLHMVTAVKLHAA